MIVMGSPPALLQVNIVLDEAGLEVFPVDISQQSAWCRYLGRCVADQDIRASSSGLEDGYLIHRILSHMPHLTI
jgi:hypothetical protein